MPSYEDHRPTLRFQSLAVSPNGRWVAHVDDAISRLSAVVQSLAGGPPQLVTSYSDSTMESVAWFPDGAPLIVDADPGVIEGHGSSGSMPMTARPGRCSRVREEVSRSRSSIGRADQIKVAMFVIPGTNGWRGPKPDSDQIVESFRTFGVEVRSGVNSDEDNQSSVLDNRVKACKDAHSHSSRSLRGAA